MEALSPQLLAIGFTLLALIILIIAGFRNMNAPGGHSYTAIMIALLVMTASIVFEVSTPNLAQKFIWLQVHTTAATATLILIGLLISEFTNWVGRTLRRAFLIASLIPVSLTLAAWTNSLHGWFWASLTPEPLGQVMLLQPVYGWAGVMYYVYGAVLLMCCLVYLLWRMQSAQRPFRSQISVLALGCGIAAVWMAAEAIIPNAAVNFSATSYGITGISLLFTWAVFRFHLLDLLPVARSRAIDHLRDGVLIADDQDKVIEINLAAQKSLGMERSDTLGKPVSKLLPETKEINGIQRLRLTQPGQPTRHFEIYQNEIQIDAPRTKARMLLLRDITDRVAFEGLVKRREAILAAVGEVATRLLHTTRWENEIHELLSQLASAARIQRATVLRVRPVIDNKLVCEVAYSWSSPGIPTPEAGQCIDLEGEGILRWADALRWRRSISGTRRQFPPAERGFFDRRQISNLLWMPVFVDADWWGVLALDDSREERLWNASEISALEVAANALGAAIQRGEAEEALKANKTELEQRVQARTRALGKVNESLQSELRRAEEAERIARQQARQLSALHNATTALLSTLDIEALLGQILDAALSAIPAAQGGTLHLIGQETGQLEMRAVLGYADSRIRRMNALRDDDYAVRAVQQRRPIIFHDVLAEGTQPITTPTSPTKPSGGDGHVNIDLTRSLLIAPLMADDQVYGAISLTSTQAEAFKEGDLHLLVSFAATATTALRNAQLHASVQRLAITDALTDLYNRRGFQELGRLLLESARRFKRPLAAIILDIDHFKLINDRYGHAIGDQVIQACAERLRRSVREVDILARMGGDEFAILLPETDMQTALTVAERLRTSIEQAPFQSTQGDVKITISQGVTRLTLHTRDLADLLNEADAALYQAKNSGRNQVRYLPHDTDPRASQLIVN